MTTYNQSNLPRTYRIEIAGLVRDLPVVPIADDLAIASFVILGDAELVYRAAAALDKKIPEVDYFMTAEAKGIPLLQEICHLRRMPRYIVARKSVKSYMKEPVTADVRSITTAGTQQLYLDGHDAGLIRGRRVCLLDDVISSGESLIALEQLADAAGAEVTARAAILAEGGAAARDDIIVLGSLPLFPISKTL